ncbi:snaclec rhodocetin subunit delta-like [Ptychodera flava]|uniref:snaclec rhodocetin subunit delta-like n=1 Tax=Ptychodera flava TaxID=63121 RepID=UPI00396A581D
MSTMGIKVRYSCQHVSPLLTTEARMMKMLLRAALILILSALATFATADIEQERAVRNRRAYADKAYYVVEVSRRQGNAEEYCRTNYKHGRLAEINTSDIEDEVAGKLADMGYSGKPMWIGLNDKREEGTLKWNNDDSTPVDYTGTWLTGASNNDQARDCVELRYINGQIRWMFNRCTTNRHFICQGEA